MASTILTGRGMDWEDLYNVLGQLRSRLVGLTTKLDADGTVTDTDYGATIVNFTFPLTPGADSREPAGGINAQGYRHIGLILDYMKIVRARFNTMCTKLDADNGAVTTYSALAMPTIIDVEGDGLQQAGQYEGTFAYWFYTYMTKFNAVLAALDVDGNVADTNYAALWNFDIGAYVDPVGTFQNV